LPWAIVAAILAKGSPWSLVLLVIVACARFTSSYAFSRWVVQDQHSRRNLWLVPLRDAVGVLIFFASFAGNTVTWRGEVFHLKDGVLYR
jgi:ceramide glucosyltransferase